MAEALHFEPTDVQVSETNLFALKSGQRTTAYGEPITSFDVSERGPVLDYIGDRWVVPAVVTDAEARTARMVSLRGWGLGKQSIDYPGDSNLTLIKNDIISPGILSVTIPGHEPFLLDTGTANWLAELDKLWKVRIHRDEGESQYTAAQLEAAPGRLLSRYLAEASPDAPERDVRFFGAPTLRELGQDRQVRPEYRADDASTTLMGADGAALLAVNEATLRAVQEAAGLTDQELSILRARPNLVLTGLEAFAEYRIKALRIGQLVMDNVGPSGRCVATGTDPETGARDNNRFIAALNKAGQTGWSAATGDRNAFFGINLQPRLRPGERHLVSVGDTVEIAWADSPNILTQKPGRE